MKKYIGIASLIIELSLAGAAMPYNTPARPVQKQESKLEAKVNVSNEKVKTEEKKPYYYDKNDNFASDSEPNVVARLLYGEASGETSNPDYMFGVLSTLKNRAATREQSLKETALDWSYRRIRDKDGKEIKRVRVLHYNCFNPKDKNHKKISDPLRYNYKTSWETCLDFSTRFTEGKIKSDNDTQKKLEGATDYWVDTQPAPYWAYETVKGKKALRKPLAVVKVWGGKHNAYFYKLR